MADNERDWSLISRDNKELQVCMEQESSYSLAMGAIEGLMEYCRLFGVTTLHVDLEAEEEDESPHWRRIRQAEAEVYRRRREANGY